MKAFLLIILSSMSSVSFAQDWQSLEGLTIESKCLDKFSVQFPQMLKSGIDHGLSCLKSLNTKKSLDHYERLSSLVNSGELMVGCTEKLSNFSKNSVAHGSISHEDDDADTGLRHPFFSISPKTTLAEYEPEFISQVAFHEIFHNIGYVHGKTIDYAYACEECCFGDETVKENACKVCKSEYSSVGDENYIDDFVQYYDSSEWNKYFMAPKVIRLGLFLNPSSQFIRSTLLDFDGYRNPLSRESALVWSKDGDTETFSDILEKPEFERTEGLVEFVRASFEARTSLYEQHDIKKASEKFLQLKPEVLKEVFRVDQKVGWLLADSILYDMDILDLKMNENDEHRERLSAIYRSLIDAGKN